MNDLSLTSGRNDGDNSPLANVAAENRAEPTGLSATEEESPLNHYLRILRRRKWLILGIVSLSMVLAIVISLLIFGLVMSGSLYVFQAINTYPFAETQNALAREFPDSRPRVEGGRLKGKENNPVTFRVTLAVPFNPHENDVQIQKMADQILEVAHQHLTLNVEDWLQQH